MITCSACREERPNLLSQVAKCLSARDRLQKFRDIADSVSAYLMVDMAHIAGLVATIHMNPVPYADFVTSTTHKTLRTAAESSSVSKSTPRRSTGRISRNARRSFDVMIASKAVAFRRFTFLQGLSGASRQECKGAWHL